MRPRVFLRTAEFLWQEGHTAHETEAEAIAETEKMLEVYATFARDYLAIPVYPGEKSESERFPGAVRTLTIEAMVQDRKAIQAGTSHFLGQNFAKASGIQFLSRQNTQEFAWTTSWGVSTRLIGTAIMAHADDDGMIVPPRLAPAHVVILPITPKPDTRDAVLAAADSLADALRAQILRRRAHLRRGGHARPARRRKELGMDQERRPHPHRDRPARPRERHRGPQPPRPGHQGKAIPAPSPTPPPRSPPSCKPSRIPSTSAPWPIATPTPAPSTPARNSTPSSPRKTPPGRKSTAASPAPTGAARPQCEATDQGRPESHHPLHPLRRPARAGRLRLLRQRPAASASSGRSRISQ